MLPPTNQFYLREIASIEGLVEDSERVNITFKDGSNLVQAHENDCCELVGVSQVDGDPSKHVGAVVYDFLEKSRIATSDEVDESGTWTFYTLKTSAGYLDWRWLGTSNGYYSESVDCYFNRTKD